MSGLLGIHHISAFTKSKEENHFFYTKVLGLVKNTVNQEHTHIRHLFYGDYTGSPGTLLTFFELPRAGQSYLENNYFSTVSLLVPKGALPYWKDRLESYEVQSTLDDEGLIFTDPDHMPLRFVEAGGEETADYPTNHSSVPVEKQLIRISGIDIAVENTEKESRFLTEWLKMKESGTALTFTNEMETFFIRLAHSNSDKQTRFDKGAIDHLALSYESLNELETKKNEAEQLGYTVEKLVNRGYFSSLYVKDPFGQRFELATLAPGFTIDEPLDELGNTLALPDFLEPQRKTIEQTLEDN